MFCMNDMVPQNHMLQQIDKAIDWSFIYDLVEEKYCQDNRRPSISDPESKWFRKGEHKHVFAYAVQTACDKHGWIPHPCDCTRTIK